MKNNHKKIFLLKLNLIDQSIKGVEKDEKKAVEYYERAAAQNHVQAIFLLGGCYQDGRGVQQDYFKALLCYLKAMKLDYSDAESRFEGLMNTLSPVILGRSSIK